MMEMNFLVDTERQQKGCKHPVRKEHLHGLLKIKKDVVLCAVLGVIEPQFQERKQK